LRRYASSTLQKEQGLEIVGMATNGFEAVQKAIELKPDLVLLSVGLSPHLNGIEAQIIDPDVMTEVLRIGGHAYISKMNAEGELLPAIRAIRRGEKFIGGGMKG
jgi:DNA-binding NarL/FixJ family response regulator